MTKAASFTFGFCLLLAVAPAAIAQGSDQQSAVDEAVYRQAYRITLRQKLADALTAEERHELPASAKLYDEAWDLVQKIGSGVDIEREQVKAGLGVVRMDLARGAERRNDLRDAKIQVEDVLRVDPRNPEAIAFLKELNGVLDEKKGKIPSEIVTKQKDTINTEKTKVNTLVQDGKFYYEMRRLDEAEAKLKEALRLDPENQSAYYMMNLVHDARYQRAVNQRDVTSRASIVDVEQAWNTTTKRELLPIPNPYAVTNLVRTSKGREIINIKLEQIHFTEFGPYPQTLPLPEMLSLLNAKAKANDPAKRGINMIINPNADVTVAPGLGGGGEFGRSGSARQPQIVDPNGGGAAGFGAAPPDDINTAQVKFDSVLNDVRLRDVLDAIVKVSDKPIKYSIEDYAIVFALKSSESAPLIVKSFRIDPNTFRQGLEGVQAEQFGGVDNSSSGSGSGSSGGSGRSSGSSGSSSSSSSSGNGSQNYGTTFPRVNVMSGSSSGGGSIGGGNNSGGGRVGGNTGNQGGSSGSGLSYVIGVKSTAEVQTLARDFFTTMGVDLQPGNGKSVFFNDRQGTLFVRATSQDLDIIEAAINVLNLAPPQVNIKAKFIEVSQDDNKAFGFDWYLGSFLTGNGNIIGSGGSQPSLNGSPSTANPSGTFPGNSAAGTTTAASSSDGQVTSGLRNASSSLFSMTGILTDPQFKVVLHALDQRQGADILACPEVTTISGRQAQMKATDIKSVVTSFDFNQGSGSANTSGGSGTIVQEAGAAFVYPTTQQIELGPTLDVLPHVLADGCTVNLTVIPTLTEFVGYDSTSEIQSAGTLPTGTVLVPTVLPHFRVRQVVSTVNVWDGQTVVLGGLLSESVISIHDKVPILGDIPFLGKLFQSQSKTSEKKNLLIFVTPSMVDQAGNRLHSDDELPFAAPFPKQDQAAMVGPARTYNVAPGVAPAAAVQVIAPPPVAVQPEADAAK